MVQLHADGRLDGHPRARRLGRLVDRDARDARAAGRRAEADGLDGRVGRHAPVRRRGRRDDDVLGRRHLRRQPRLGADHGERRRRDRGHGRRDGAAARGEAARRRDDVRRHDAVRDACARAARGARLRGARLPRDGRGRAVAGGARARRLPRRRARRDDDRARGRARRRRALRRPRPARGGGRGGRAAGRLARRARHGQLRPARDGAAAVRGPQPLRAQPDGDAHAHDAGGVRRARPHDRPQALRRATGRRCSSCR